MRKRTKTGWIPSSMGSRLIVLAMFFLIGAAVGSYFAANMSDIGREYMQAYIDGGPGPAGISGALPAAALELALLLAVFLSAFFRAGAVVPPLAMCAKGFMLSLLITSFVRAFGLPGFLASFSALVLYGFIPVACLVLVSLQSVGASLERMRAGRGFRMYMDRSFYFATALCAAAAAVSSVLHVYVTPMLSRVVIG